MFQVCQTVKLYRYIVFFLITVYIIHEIVVEANYEFEMFDVYLIALPMLSLRLVHKQLFKLMEYVIWCAGSLKLDCTS